MSRLRWSLVLVFACSVACKGEDAGDGAKAEPKAEAKIADTAKAEAGAGAGADDGQADAAEGSDDANTAAEGDSATETETGEELAPAPASFDEVGVEVCDQYVADYVACIDAKVPEAERDAQRRSVNENVQAWKQMASSGPSADKGLQTACRIAREQAKRVTADWGCEW